ncbi:hypothetical protein V8E51_004520 [Hyaloscypha variabilis]|uniref:Uncharacterized protein n=1 Tax=Hyaloscypha variabilis (strain UAMH 11265 / GT02V1 / F) TaxID=1149755 RepID=A0A2J6RDB5_HYAVF|nr:hypothetical protein L207DRAFT_586218 [Hyaloscypha variabilis F]
MSEPYKKVGRGGAGNFYSKKTVEDIKGKGKAVDPEALPPATADLARAISASLPAPEYLHTGRGGAGNWLKPTDLTSSGLTQTTSPDPTSIAPSSSSPTEAGPSSPSPSSSSPTSTFATPAPRPGIGVSKRVLGGSKPTYKGGRGGAGNYTDFEAEERARREEEERVRAEMERRVERDVEAGLERPARAYGGVVGGSYEMN